MTGQLYIVATPIGNLEDISLRALRTLKEVHLIACEDTRQTLKLLEFYQIKTPLVSYHDFNEEKRAHELVEKLRKGNDIALVSDAGTPGISDPGYRIISLAAELKFSIIPIPGASAFLSALVISGLPTDRFIFEGFLPEKKMARRKHLMLLKEEERTIVFYESPKRIHESLEDALEILGDRRATLARELTKKFESVERGSLRELVDGGTNSSPKGEYVLVLEGKKEVSSRAQDSSIEEEIEEAIQKLHLSKKEAIQWVAHRRGSSKREVYQHTLRENKSSNSPF
ncbi:MAG: 16S rRNA (cytidine(1402)-2'-O)-methyltransferase [Chlamydiae bacterium]|nr:16S rRNA (cytidine(1402)-2'-O)-methyltransferase [Chlamydiota bacterium]